MKRWLLSEPAARRADRELEIGIDQSRQMLADQPPGIAGEHRLRIESAEMRLKLGERAMIASAAGKARPGSSLQRSRSPSSARAASSASGSDGMPVASTAVDGFFVSQKIEMKAMKTMVRPPKNQVTKPGAATPGSTRRARRQEAGKEEDGALRPPAIFFEPAPSLAPLRLPARRGGEVPAQEVLGLVENAFELESHDLGVTRP